MSFPGLEITIKWGEGRRRTTILWADGKGKKLNIDKELCGRSVFYIYISHFKQHVKEIASETV